jgi:hypothetical protein
MTRDQFAVAVRRLYNRIPPLTKDEIILGMARIVAMIGDGFLRYQIGGSGRAGHRTSVRLWESVSHWRTCPSEGLLLQHYADIQTYQ